MASSLTSPFLLKLLAAVSCCTVSQTVFEVSPFPQWAYAVCSINTVTERPPAQHLVLY